MRYAIMNSSGNVLEWFEDRGAAMRALADMGPGASVDIVAFDGSGRVIDDRRSLVWSTMPNAAAASMGSVVTTVIRSSDIIDVGAKNVTDDRVTQVEPA